MALTLISTPLDITTSDTAVSSVAITSGIDDTYDSYEFHFVNMVPSTNASILAFQVDTGTNTSYNQQITSSTFEAEHDEGDSGAALQYRTNRDQANGTEYQQLGEYIYSNTADESGSGVLTLYAPSSPTYVKHWASVFNAYGNAVTQVSYHGGYINTATAITRIRFAMVNNAMAAQGNIEAGTIKMFGVS